MDENRWSVAKCKSDTWWHLIINQHLLATRCFAFSPPTSIFFFYIHPMFYTHYTLYKMINVPRERRFQSSNGENRSWPGKVWIIFRKKKKKYPRWKTKASSCWKCNFRGSTWIIDISGSKMSWRFKNEFTRRTWWQVYLRIGTNVILKKEQKTSYKLKKRCYSRIGRIALSFKLA